MWVSSKTSRGGGDRSVSSACHTNHRATTNARDVPAFTWNVLLRVCTAIVLLNTVGLITLVCADTIQYPVTAPFGSVIPTGKSPFTSLVYSDRTAAGAASFRSTNELKAIKYIHVKKQRQSIDTLLFPHFTLNSQQ